MLGEDDIDSHYTIDDCVKSHSYDIIQLSGGNTDGNFEMPTMLSMNQDNGNLKKKKTFNFIYYIYCTKWLEKGSYLFKTKIYFSEFFFSESEKKVST